jgi:hypothetical protein
LAGPAARQVIYTDENKLMQITPEARAQMLTLLEAEREDEREPEQK